MTRLRFAALILASLLTVPSLATPQSQVPEFLQVSTVTVKLGMQTEFEDYLKKIIAAASKLNSRQLLVTHQVTMGGSPLTYFVTSPFEKWAGADALESAPAILAKAYGDVEGAKILKVGRGTIETLDVAVYRLLPGMSTNPVPIAQKAHLNVIRTEVELGMQAEYNQYLAMLKGAQDKDSASPTSIRRVSVAGPAAVYVTTQAFDTFAERDNWPNLADQLKKAYGDAQAQLILNQGTRTAKSRVVVVTTYRADLSKATTTASSN